jgi:hypothetical protein
MCYCGALHVDCHEVLVFGMSWVNRHSCDAQLYGLGIAIIEACGLVVSGESFYNSILSKRTKS